MNVNTRFREYILGNGLHVALQETPTQTIAVRLTTNYGSLHEREGQEGFAHLLEHGIMGSGTEKYTPEEADFIKTHFGYFNATTYLDRTTAVGDILIEDLDLYCDFSSDLFFNPRLNPVRIDEERQTVLREIADEKSSLRRRDVRDYNRALFGDHPITYFSLGKESVISNASIDDLRVFHVRGYNATNMNLILVGGLPKNIDEVVLKYFGGKPGGKSTKLQLVHLKPLERKFELRRQAPELYNTDNPSESSAEINIGALVPSQKDDYAALEIIGNVLGSGPNSRLFKYVRQRKGLAYRIGASFYRTFNIGGFISISGNIPSVNQDRAIDAIFDEIRKLRTEPIPDRELKEIVRHGRYEIGKSLETNDGHVESIERKFETGRTPEMAMATWENVTPERLLEAAQTYLPQSRDEGNYVIMIRDPLLK